MKKKLLSKENMNQIIYEKKQPKKKKKSKKWQKIMKKQ